jgi:hypothetical protein
MTTEETSMNDVNPLGPMMHLKEIERKALVLRAAAKKGHPKILDMTLGWVKKPLKLLFASLRAISAGRAHVGRR